MRTRPFFAGLSGLALLFSLSAALPTPAQAQSSQPARRQQPTLSLPTPTAERAAAARDSELYCAGYIEYAPNYSALQIVGGEEEQEQYSYSVGDFVYIFGGSQQGVRVGDQFTVVRPRGLFKSKLSKKDGWLGVFTQEVGRLRVVEVKEKVSVAFVAGACDLLMLGDLLRSAPVRTSPAAQNEDEFDRFADPNNKPLGRIVMARDMREMLSVEQVVYIDLGTEDNVRVGDRLTVYREVGKGGVNRFREEEITPSASYGFESEIFRGGKVSINAPRVQMPHEDSIHGPMQTTAKVKRQRPKLPRKNVGEMVVLNVQKRTATAIITRAVQELHTGDHVEVK